MAFRVLLWKLSNEHIIACSSFAPHIAIAVPWRPDEAPVQRRHHPERRVQQRPDGLVNAPEHQGRRAQLAVRQQIRRGAWRRRYTVQQRQCSAVQIGRAHV